MNGDTRRARVTALAKLNLDLRVLERRPDQYHELRTVFQTISLGDRLEIAFTPARKTSLEIEDEAQIPDNLVLKAAALAMEEMRTGGRVEFRLEKRIPMGGGLGGGSSDAAAVLLALPVLVGRAIALERLMELAAHLGSDVPFFLLGGRAVGIGRGTELFPLPDGPPRRGVLISTGVHVSTAAAYAALGPRLTTESEQNKIVSFQSRLWSENCLCEREESSNDFETVVFAQHPKLGTLKRRLQKSGAKPAMMTGSGSALFGLFETREKVARAIQEIGRGVKQIFPISLVSRSQYRAMWWRGLHAHLEDKRWPPRSRYVR
jgi:4-diphosphocytidyl-2-C-methyl-D-erythritol kinase